MAFACGSEPRQEHAEPAAKDYLENLASFIAQGFDLRLGQRGALHQGLDLAIELFVLGFQPRHSHAGQGMDLLAPTRSRNPYASQGTPASCCPLVLLDGLV